ncbi:MAG: hypothetical protein Q7S18_01685 [bacterium]|nr:hypothetical protein [bacterium]
MLNNAKKLRLLVIFFAMYIMLILLAMFLKKFGLSDSDHFAYFIRILILLYPINYLVGMIIGWSILFKTSKNQKGNLKTKILLSMFHILSPLTFYFLLPIIPVLFCGIPIATIFMYNREWALWKKILIGLLNILMIIINIFVLFFSGAGFLISGFGV